ncbi:hypothetical protein AB1Y20_013933 [Prymnesium parvum]|uniref:Aquaporin n=1 Tax=Prymnesium parvum TaxID=97485 RepID=A0AB34IED6_PRYPA
MAAVDQKTPAFYGVFVRGMGTDAYGSLLKQSKLTALLGAREIFSRRSYGAALTEFNFTMLLHFFHVSIVRAATAQDARGAAVFASPALAIAAAKFVVILLCTYAGAASGAHMNPNITLATAMLGLTSVTRCLMYTAAQLLGALCGVAAARVAHGWEIAASAAELGACHVGDVSQPGALVATFVFFLFLLSIIGGVAFDDKQGSIFGPILAPVCISAAVGVCIFASAKTAIMINWVECVAVGIVGGEFNGSEWISFVGPTLASIWHACLFITVPPSQEKFEPPLFRSLRLRENESQKLS